MRNARRANIDRSDFDEQDIPPVTLEQADAALYGAIARVDKNRREVDRTKFGAFRLTPTGLEIGSNPQQADWELVGQFLFQMESGIQWLIGDWLAYGEDVKWGHATKFAEAFGRDPSTLHNYSSISRKVQFSLRSENLSYNHHVLVAPYTPEEQAAYLQYALHGEEKPLSLVRFRAWINSVRGDELAKSLPDPADVISKPLAGTFFKLLRRDKAEAAAYLRQVRQWISAMEEQYFTEK